jgi:hypothetical protein
VDSLHCPTRFNAFSPIRRALLLKVNVLSTPYGEYTPGLLWVRPEALRSGRPPSKSAWAYRTEKRTG